MYSKTLLYIGVFIGSTIGGSLPSLWGADVFSISSLILGAVGGLLGIWAAVKMSDYFGL